MSSRRSNLPAPVSSFVGRDREIAEVLEHLDSSRLVTLTGPAGVGKTRLALEVAARAAGKHREGTWLVELASLVDASMVAHAVADALSLREQRLQPATEVLVEHLRTHSVLLVLDNCEHVVEACAELVDALLRACHRLRILATSREFLRITGEVVWPVPPLAVPDLTMAHSVEALAQSDAVRLFVERSGLADPTLGSVAAAVGEICGRLDGIPLAIELAATRVGVLSPAQIAARLDDRFRLLTGGSRTAVPRHRTLLAAIEWSHELLTECEQAMLRRLAVFAGGWTLDAAVDVCGGGGPRGEVLDCLHSLVSKSLVVSETTGADIRFRILETIREYGRTRLELAGEDAALREAHARWCCHLAEAAEAELSGPSQPRWMERLDTEHSNIRAALDRTLGCGRHDLALRLAAALPLFWLVRGYIVEGRDWLQRALTAHPDGAPPLRARALWGIGLLSSMLGDFATASSAADESLALFRAARNGRGEARALNLQGVVKMFTEPTVAAPLLGESAELARRSADTWCLSGALGMLGFAHIFQGQFDAARPPLEECLEVSRQLTDRQGQRLGLLGLGYVALRQGDLAAAADHLNAGLAVARSLGDTLWTAVALVYLGELASARGDHPTARALSGEGVTLARLTRSPSILGFCLGFHGRVILAAGDCASARSLFTEAIGLPRSAGHRGNVAMSLLGLGCISLRDRDLSAARDRFADAYSVARESGDQFAVSQVVHCRGILARAEGDLDTAVALHHEALSVQLDIGHRCGVAGSLEAIAALLAEQGRVEHAAPLFGAAAAIVESGGFARPVLDQADHERNVGLARAAMCADDFLGMWTRGAALSGEEAVALAQRGRGRRRRPSSGWASLTGAERQVTRLVAEGLTNPEIGERLFVSPRTVQTHVSHIFVKLGIASRRELARAVRERTPDTEG